MGNDAKLFLVRQSAGNMDSKYEIQNDKTRGVIIMLMYNNYSVRKITFSGAEVESGNSLSSDSKIYLKILKLLKRSTYV